MTRGQMKTKNIELCEKIIYNIEMEEHALKNVDNCFNTNISSYLETFGGQFSILNLNVFFVFVVRGSSGNC
jgi:hypothetical protein